MNSVITIKAQHKILRARAGEAGGIIPKIKGVMIGDGGTDTNGNLIAPSPDATRLNNMILKRECEAVMISDVCYRYRITLGKDELIGSKVSEAALYDADGDLLVIYTFSEKQKDEGMELSFEFDDQF